MHKHQLARIRVISEDYKILWCVDCGLICEFMSTGVAEMVPEWSRERLLNEGGEENKFEYELVKDFDDLVPTSKRRLGKGLKDIKSSPPNFLKNLLTTKDKT